MTTIASALEKEFTPSVGDFIAQVTNGYATLARKNSSGAAFASVGEPINGAVIVDNPISGAVYKFVAYQGAPAVQADQ
jgi:hypothetical protein